MASSSRLRSVVWLTVATVVLFQLSLPAQSDAFLFDRNPNENGDLPKERHRRGISSLLQRLLDLLRGGTSPVENNLQGCRPARSIFGSCNNSWTDFTPEEVESEAADLLARRAANPVAEDADFQQPIRQIAPDANAQFFGVDVGIDPEWSAQYLPSVQFAATVGPKYTAQDNGILDSFDEYANVSQFFQQTFANNPPIPSAYNPWVFHPQTDPSLAVEQRWNDDSVFAAARLAGYNPATIYRIGSRGLPVSRIREFMNRDFDWDGAVTAASGYSYRGALLRRRLFAQYHPILRNVTQYRGAFAGQKFLTPFALFVLPPGEQLIRVVAIQLGMNRSSPVHSPASSFFWWTYSKLAANNAYAIQNNILNHLHNAHFTGARFAIVTQRELSSSHPVRLLMDRHLRGIHQTNTFGYVVLVNRGSILDRETLLSFDGIAEYLSQAYQKWNYREMSLPKEVAYRGCQFLPYYPYYQDGMRIFNLLRQYVSGYMRLYYCCNQQVRNDEALQRWVRTSAVDINEGKRGIPKRLKSVSQLVEYITNQLWTYSGYHAAFNYPNADYFYAPSAPLAVALRPEEINLTRAEATTPDNLEYLTDILGGVTNSYTSAVDYATLAFSLTGMKFQDLLGNTPLSVANERTTSLQDFIQRRLDNLETTITRENVNRVARGQLPYRYLLPSEITGSTSI